MKIAVCEDEERDRRRLLKQLEAALNVLELEAEVECFDTAEKLLAAAESTFYSIFFLDILLPGLSGMNAALKLRRSGNHSPVVFTTISEDYRTQSNSVWAVGYLVKPFGQADVDEALSRAARVLAGESRTLAVTVARHTEYIPYSDIYYIEGSNRNCILHTRTGVYSPYYSVQGLLAALDDDRFFHSHRSYIINLDHVLAVQRGKVAMRDDALLPIRRDGTDAVRSAWENRRFKQVRERD